MASRADLQLVTSDGEFTVAAEGLDVAFNTESGLRGTGDFLSEDLERSGPRRVLASSDLYPAEDLTSKHGIEQIFRLVEVALEALSEIRSLIRAGDLVGADDRTHHLIRTVADLFIYRELGDGFGCRVVALYNCLVNAALQPLEEAQLTPIRRVIVSLRDEPHESFELCMDYVDGLEEAGLNPDPKVATALDSALDVLTER